MVEKTLEMTLIQRSIDKGVLHGRVEANQYVPSRRNHGRDFDLAEET